MADGTGLNIGGVDITVNAGVDRFNRTMVQVEQRGRRAGGVLVKEFDKADNAAGRLERTLMRSSSALGLFGGAFGAGLLVKGVIDAADSMKLLQGRIGNVISSSENLNSVWKDIYNTAQSNRQSLEATAQLYLRLRNAVRDMTHEQALGISSTFSQTLIISGASASEAASSITQFSQAMASNKFAGDEFKSILENNSRFAILLADSLGVTIGQLRELSEAGALTTDVISKAVSEQAASISAEFAGIPTTVGQATQQLTNALQKYIGDTDKSLGATQRLASGISLLADHVDELGDALLVLSGAAVGGVLAGTLIKVGSATTKFASNIRAALSDIAAGTSPAYRKLAEQRTFALLNVEADLQKAVLARQAAEKAARDYRQAVIAGDKNPQQLGGYKGLASRRLQFAVDMENTLKRTQVVAANLDNEYARMERSVTGRLTQIGTVMGRIGGNILNFFGGPVGLAITAASLAFAFFVHEAQAAERRVQSVTAGLSAISDLQYKVADANEEAGRTAEEAAAAEKKRTEQLARQVKVQAALVELKKQETRATIALALVNTQEQISAGRRMLENARRQLDAASGASGGTGLRTGRTQASPQRIGQLQKNFDDLTAKVGAMEKGTKLFEDALKDIDAGLVDFGNTVETVATDPLEKFRKQIENIRKGSQDPKLKSSLVGNMLKTLGESDLKGARAEFEKVKDLLTPQDAVTVEKAFSVIARASIRTTSGLNEFNTVAQEFAKTMKEIRQADPLGGDKSKAAAAALIAYGQELKNIPAAMAAIPSLKDVLKPEDAETARKELEKLALEAYQGFGTDKAVANKKYAETLKEINEAEAALIATGAKFDPADFDAARAIAGQENRDAIAGTVDDYSDLASIIEEMFTPVQKLNEALADLANLRATEREGSLGAIAVDRKRIELLEDQARATGEAAAALRELYQLQNAAGLTPADARAMANKIRDAAAQGRSGKMWSELTDQQRLESAADFFAHTFADSMVEGLQSGNFGEALRDVIAKAAAEGLAESLSALGQRLGDGIKQGGWADTAIQFVGSLATGSTPSFPASSASSLSANYATMGSAQAWSEQGLKSAAVSVKMGDVHIAGDVGSAQQIDQIRKEMAEQARALPRTIKATMSQVEARR